MKRITHWFRRRERRTVRLPAKGKALVISDLHGNWHDWRAFLAKTRVLERIEAGEDLWLLITGDIPDVVRHQAVDPRVPADGDLRILDELIATRARLAGRGDRIVYVEGNHDFHVARIAGEVARYHAHAANRAPPDDGDLPAVSPEDYAAYCDYYRKTYGEEVFENNMSPYDMVPRARAEHLRFLKSGPILVVLEGARLQVTHAGPPRMWSARARDIQRQIDGAHPESLRLAAPEAYFDSPYHQLLNNRYRNGNYSLGDVSAFLEAYGADLLVSGHTPLPYLVDFERRAPLESCSFRAGLGLIGERQLVLCTSFGAFTPGWKRYLEIDLSRPYPAAEMLIEGGAVLPLYTSQETASQLGDPLPGAEFAGTAD